ncbi:hypothetical protein TrCOL_g8913, partial [Triparma columacea]
FFAAAVGSISPSSGSIVGGTIVTVTGANFEDTNDLSCLFGTLESPAAVYKSSTEVECEAPLSSSSGFVSLKVTVNGVDYTTDASQFLFLEVAKLISIEPASGSVDGGTSILVTGYGFVDSSQLKCNFGSTSVLGRYISPTQVECESPPSISGAVNVEVSMNGIDFTSSSSTFLYSPPPSASSISPSFGPSSGGTSVTISGNSFELSKDLRCRFGTSDDISASYISFTSIACIAPFSSTDGTVEVSVSNNGLDFFPSSADFEYKPTPLITMITPPSDNIAGGAIVTVTGTNFENTSFLSCLFDGTPSPSTTFVSSTSVTCEVPPITSSSSDNVAFDFLGDPELFSFEPISGATTGGTSVLIIGYNFANTNHLSCKFGEVTSTERLISPIECDTPAAADDMVGLVDVSVSLDGVSFFTLDAQFAYIEPLAIGSIAPQAGPSSGWTEVVISGGNFVFSKDLKCRFDETEVLAVFVSAQAIICVRPSSLEESVAVSVANNGVDFMKWDDAFSIVAAPSITSVVPSKDSIVGGTVVALSGSGFTDTPSNKCIFGFESVAATYISSATLTCTSPPSSTPTASSTVSLEITNDDKDFTTFGNTFQYIKATQITSVSPSFGATSGGTEVTVSGYNFEDRESIKCKFGASEVDGTFLFTTAVACAAPATGAGSVDVEISLNGGVDYTSSSNVDFEFFSDVTIVGITGVLPSRIPESPNLSCKFGDKFVKEMFLSSTQLSCITAPADDVVGDVTVHVCLNCVDFSVDSAYKFDAPIQVDSVTPSFGPILGGTIVRVVVNNVRYTGAVGCRFGDVFVTATFLSAQEIECISPSSGSVGSVDVNITLNGVDYDNAVVGTATFTYVPTPGVLGISPRTGWRDGGVELTLSTKNLVGSGLGSLECSFVSRYGSVRTPVSHVDESLDVVTCLTPPQKQAGAQVVNLDDTVGVSLVYSSSPKSGLYNIFEFPIDFSIFIFIGRSTTRAGQEDNVDWSVRIINVE